MISFETFVLLRQRLGQQGVDDIAWSEACGPPVDADDFANEIGYVIVNSGMKNTVAMGIWRRILDAREQGLPATKVFGHAGKAAAIDRVWAERVRLFRDYTDADDKLAFIETLPWIGKVTKYHVAKNFGIDCCKPDVHLVRLAQAHATTPEALCRELAQQSGYRVATVDLLLWRACATGVLDSRSGKLVEPPPHAR